MKNVSFKNIVIVKGYSPVNGYKLYEGVNGTETAFKSEALSFCSVVSASYYAKKVGLIPSKIIIEELN